MVWRRRLLPVIPFVLTIGVEVAGLPSWVGVALIVVGLVLAVAVGLAEMGRLPTVERQLDGSLLIRMPAARRASKDAIRATAARVVPALYSFRRELAPHPTPSPETWDADVAKMAEWYEDRNLAYGERFGGDVAWLRSELARRRLIDEREAQTLAFTTLAGPDPLGERARIIEAAVKRL